MAGKGARVRVDRGDGKLINMYESEVEAFTKLNPGAKIAAQRVVNDGPTPQEEAATVALETARTKAAGKRGQEEAPASAEGTSEPEADDSKDTKAKKG